MSDLAARSFPEPEPSAPEESFAQWRRAQEEVRYRRWCEEVYGMVQIGPETIHPAEVLGALRADADRRGRDEARASFRTDLEATVCEDFPSPVAIPYNAFLYGSLDPLKRLLYLRDSWEGLIHLLSALALSKCAALAVPLHGFNVRTSDVQNPTPCKAKDLRTDSLALRIGLFEGALNRCRELGIELEITRYVPDGLVTEIRRLNTIRNGFSHESAKSDSQAQLLIDEAYPLLREVFVDLADLAEIELFRLRSIKAGAPPAAEVERLVGHAQSKRVRSLPLNDNFASVALAATPVDTFDRVLAKIGPKLVDLCPYFCAVDDDTGHRTRVIFFKSNRNGEWHMEVVGESVPVHRPEGPHEAEMARFYALLD
jgi:hypothetical protein